MSSTRAADDADTISARLRELEAERQRARNAECLHEWSEWADFCTKCGLSRAAYIMEREGVTGYRHDAPEGGNG